MKPYWIIRVPDLTIDRVNLQHLHHSQTMEQDHPVIIVPTLYMLDADDQEEALFAALCQVMPKSSQVGRKGGWKHLGHVACAGMGQCYWLKGKGWLDEPAPGAVYYDPFDLLAKTPFLYKV